MARNQNPNPENPQETQTSEAANSQAQQPQATQTPQDGTPADSAEKVKLTVRHKSTLPNYYRAGLRFTREYAEYEVPADKVAAIKADKWLEVKER